jgi:hypothetical protein
MGEDRNTCRVLVRKPDEIKLFRRPSFRWENNINKMDLKGIG